MFADAWTQYLAVDEAIGAGDLSAREYLRESARSFFEFAVADLARHQLMNQRTIPGFEPSPRPTPPRWRRSISSAPQLGRFGVTEDEDVDLCTALIGGLDRPAARQ